MFEMIYADRPFRGKQKKENIMKGEYKMPTSKFTHLSTPCKNFIKDLLQTNLTKRLGCGLEGMKKYKDHPFFKTAWIEKPPKNVIGAEPPDVAKKIKPINWRKLERKEIEPLFVPFAPRVILDVGKKKKIEKNTEEDKAKEAEKEADFIALENVQRKEFQDQQPAIEYPALKEKFLVFLLNLVL